MRLIRYLTHMRREVDAKVLMARLSRGRNPMSSRSRAPTATSIATSRVVRHALARPVWDFIPTHTEETGGVGGKRLCARPLKTSRQMKLNSP